MTVRDPACRARVFALRPADWHSSTRLCQGRFAASRVSSVYASVGETMYRTASRASRASQAFLRTGLALALIATPLTIGSAAAAVPEAGGFAGVHAGPAVSTAESFLVTGRDRKRATVSWSDGNRLTVNVGPDRPGKRSFTLKLLRKRAGSWHKVATYRTRGSSEIRRLALPKGKYRVRVMAAGKIAGTRTGTITYVPPRAVGTQARVKQLVDQARATPTRCGKARKRYAPPLRTSRNLARAAQFHAADMRRTGRMTHYSTHGSRHYPRGTGPAGRAQREGYGSAFVGENVAYGYPNPRKVVRGWLRSPGHCKNIMRRGFADVGVGRSGNFWALTLGKRT